LSEHYGIPVEWVRVARISYTWNFTRANLPSEKWFTLHENLDLLAGSPWYLSLDGVLFIVKDESEALRPLTQDEK
jgi:hypothetical protein